MDFRLSDEQKAIAELADSIFSELCTDERLDEFDSSDEPFMQDVWEQCVESGLHSLAIQEEAGGFGLGITDLMVILEAQGRHLAQIPLWQHQLAAATLHEFAGETHKNLIEGAAGSEQLLTLSLDGAGDALGVQLEGHEVTDGFVLNGRVVALPLAMESAAALVLARFQDGISLVVIHMNKPGISAIPARLSHGESVANLQLENYKLNKEDVLEVEAIDWLEQRVIAAISALQLGVSSEHIRRTVEYINERQQFDRVISSFQAVQMTMADAHIATETLRSVLWQLVYRLDVGLPAASEAMSCNYLASQTGHSVGHKAQHVHGGIGVDLTYPIHRYLYWSRTLGITLGGSLSTLERLGDWLNENDTLGWKYDLDESQVL